MGSYIVIDDEIIQQDVNLTEIILLGLIKGFSQNKQGVFYGTRGYMQSWVKCKSHHTVDKALARLCACGMIEKGTIIDEGVVKVSYRYIGREGKKCPGAKNAQGEGKICPDMGAKNAHYNNTIDNSIDNKYNQTITRTREDEDAEKVAQLREKFERSLDPYRSKYSDIIPDFIDYWAAPLVSPKRGSGKYLLYQEQKTWDIAARLRTWRRISNERKQSSRSSNYHDEIRRGVEGRLAAYDAYHKSFAEADRLYQQRMRNQMLKEEDERLALEAPDNQM